MTNRRGESPGPEKEGAMIEGRYYSPVLGTFIFAYPARYSEECDCCGKVAKNPIAFVREDDENCCEYIYGSVCFRKLKAKKQ